MESGGSWRPRYFCARGNCPTCPSVVMVLGKATVFMACLHGFLQALGWSLWETECWTSWPFLGLVLSPEGFLYILTLAWAPYHSAEKLNVFLLGPIKQLFPAGDLSKLHLAISWQKSFRCWICSNSTTKVIWIMLSCFFKKNPSVIRFHGDPKESAGISTTHDKVSKISRQGENIRLNGWWRGWLRIKYYLKNCCNR